VKFGISPFGIWRNARTDPAGSRTSGLQSYDAIYADTRTWVRNQWIDYIVPQLYWPIGFAKADYAILLPWWSALVRGTRVQLYIGQADYRAGEPGPWRDPAQLTRQLALNDRYGVAGSVHFSAKQVRADPLGAVTRYRTAQYAEPALLPPMAQLPAWRPGRPLLVSPRSAPGGRVTFDWQRGTGPAPVSWALYRVSGASAPLVAVGRAGTPLAAVAPGTYCLSALDRSGNEGPPSAPVSG
jgi:glycosyl hydrolase family 10